jgi:hypothetical protein
LARQIHYGRNGNGFRIPQNSLSRFCSQNATVKKKIRCAAKEQRTSSRAAHAGATQTPGAGPGPGRPTENNQPQPTDPRHTSCSGQRTTDPPNASSNAQETTQTVTCVPYSRTHIWFVCLLTCWPLFVFLLWLLPTRQCHGEKRNRSQGRQTIKRLEGVA